MLAVAFGGLSMVAGVATALSVLGERAPIIRPDDVAGAARGLTWIFSIGAATLGGLGAWTRSRVAAGVGAGGCAAIVGLAASRGVLEGFGDDWALSAAGACAALAMLVGFVTSRFVGPIGPVLSGVVSFLVLCLGIADALLWDAWRAPFDKAPLGGEPFFAAILPVAVPALFGVIAALIGRGGVAGASTVALIHAPYAVKWVQEYREQVLARWGGLAATLVGVVVGFVALVLGIARTSHQSYEPSDAVDSRIEPMPGDMAPVEAGAHDATHVQSAGGALPLPVFEPAGGLSATDVVSTFDDAAPTVTDGAGTIAVPVVAESSPASAGPAFAPPSRVEQRWATDPYGRFAMRFWNGERWTEHVSDGTTQSVDWPY